jgi:hypothetical protein
MLFALTSGWCSRSDETPTGLFSAALRIGDVSFGTAVLPLRVVECSKYASRVQCFAGL